MHARYISYLRKVVLALVLTGFFSLLSFFPSLGYFGEAYASKLYYGSEGAGWLKVHADCNMTYNPFLYSFSWLGGRGISLDSFDFWSKPLWTTGGIAWRSLEELGEEAIIRTVLGQLSINIPFNFILILLIGLTEMQDLYLCLIVGIIGFPIGGPIGAFASFFAGLSCVVFIRLRLVKEGILVKISNFLFESGEYSARE